MIRMVVGQQLLWRADLFINFFFKLSCQKYCSLLYNLFFKLMSSYSHASFVIKLRFSCIHSWKLSHTFKFRRSWHRVNSCASLFFGKSVFYSRLGQYLRRPRAFVRSLSPRLNLTCYSVDWPCPQKSCLQPFVSPVSPARNHLVCSFEHSL